MAHHLPFSLLSLSSTIVRSFARRKSVHFSRYFSVASAELPLETGSPSSLPEDSRKVSEKVENIVDQIANLSLLEVADLNYALKKRLNIPDTPMMPSGMFIGPNVSALQEADAESNQPAEPQKISFRVKLTGFDESKKVALIKEIRNVVDGLNLVQAKKFVDSVPVSVKQDIGKTEAEELKTLLENAGGFYGDEVVPYLMKPHPPDNYEDFAYC